MAKYGDIVAGLTIGDYGSAGPAGWTGRWDTGSSQNLDVIEDLNSPSGKALRLWLTASSRTFYGWDGINADPDRGTSTTIALIVPQSRDTGAGASFGGPVARGNGNNTSETGAVAAHGVATASGESVFRAITYTNASSSLTDSTASSVWTTGVPFWLKLSVSGTTMTVTAYAENDLNGTPLAPVITRSCPASNSNNWHGLFGFASDTDYLVRYMAIGTGSDQPDPPPVVVDPPATAPGNPSAVAQSSSVIRSSWDAVSGATGYKIRLDNVDFIEPLIIDVGNVLTFDVESLEALEEYSFEYAGYNSAGDGPYSTAIFETTLAAGVNLVLITEFDAGNVSQTLTTIINPEAAEPVVNIEFRPEMIDGTNGTGWTVASFAFGGDGSKRPLISINRNNMFLKANTPSIDYLPSYTQDFVNFIQAPSRTLVGGSTGRIEFQFTDPFPAGTVYVMTAPIGQQAAAAPYAAALLANYPSVVSPTGSADANGVYFTSPAELDENGRECGGHDMYALKFEFGGSTTDGGPKRKAVISYGQHAMGEAQAWFAFKSFIEYLLDSTDAEAVRDRANFDYYVYFNITPNGIFAGHRRHNPTRTQDPNRQWIASPVLVEIAATKNAIIADTGGSINVCFDFHGAASRTENFIVFAPPSAKTTRFVELGELVFGETAYTDITNITGSMAEFCVNELSADFASATEMQGRGDTSLANYQNIGVKWAKTLAAADADGMFYTPSLNLTKSTLTVQAKALQLSTGFTSDLQISTLALNSKNLAISNGYSANLVKSLLNLNDKNLILNAGYSANLVKSVLSVNSKTLQFAAGEDLSVHRSTLNVTAKALELQNGYSASVIKSTAVIVGKTLSLSTGLNLELNKSALTVNGKQLIADNGASYNGVLNKSQLNVVSKGLIFETEDNITLQKSVLVVQAKTLNIEYGFVGELEKSTLNINAKTLSLGTVAISLPADRIFTIPTNNTVFNIR